MTMRILVTGAGGMLGQDVVAAVRAAGHEPVGLDRAELDVTDAGAVRAAVAAAAPDVVVNCAAYTNVDGAEAEEALALAINGAGAGNVARAGVRTIHVSTDYVFDGTKGGPYFEDDPVGPRSAYGRTKLAGEREVAAAGEAHTIARTAWLFGTGGGNFVETMLRLAADRDEVAVVGDQVGCPTFTGHLARALVELAGRDAPGVRHVAGAGSCSWNAFAKEIFRQAGVECPVADASSAEMARPAPRPANSVLHATRPGTPYLPAWEDGLAEYLAARERAGAAAEVAS